MDFIKKSLKALSYLRISDYNEGNNYNEWVGIAAALKNIGVPYREFDAWCNGGSNYQPEANQKAWDALNPTESVDQSVGWLIKLAQREGMPFAEVKEAETTYPHQIDDTEKIVSDAATVIRLLFHENEHINLIPSTEKEGKTEYQWTYEGKPFFTTSEKVIEWIGKSSSKHFSNGVLWRVNPLDGNDMNDKNVVAYRHALIEADGIGIQEQIDFIKKLKLPYVGLVHSGNKSVHCYVKIEADNAEEFKSRVSFLYDFCLRNGFQIDKANRNPSRACRIPGVHRGNQWQHVIAYGDSEFNSWREWYKWAAEYTPSKTKTDKRSITSAENGKQGGRPPIIYQLTEQFAQHYIDTNGKFTLGFHRGWFYEYKDGVYRKCEDIRIESNIMGFLQDRAKENATPNMVNSIKANLLSPNFAYLDDSIPSPFHKGKGKITDNIINMKNGLLNIDLYLKLKAQGHPTQKSLIPHTPDFFSTIQLPYDFNPDAQCPKFIKYLERVQPIEENRDVIKMLMGLSLIPDTSYNVFFVLFGDGGSGKSVFLHILENIVGRQNVCAVALHELADRFSVAPITEKLLNIVGDLPTEDMSAPITKVEGVLKRITSGETIGVEYKHRDRYEATPTARCVFATNTLPYFADKTSAFWDRIRIIPFSERIRGSSEENRNLKYEIVEEELSGIFNLAIEGLNDLLKLERFPDSETSIRIKEEHRKSCDPTRIFLEEAYKVVNPEYWTSTALMYSRYQAYCKANGYRAKNQGNFLDTVRFMFKGTTTKRIRNDRGEQITVAYGIELRTDYRDIEE